MKAILNHWKLYAAALLLTSCAQLGIPTANTFNERLAAGYGAVTEVRTTATTLLNAKKIGSSDAENVLATTDVARQGLDVARSLSKTDMTAAEGKVSAIRATLTAVAGYVATRK
jgi:hypothetical protein